MRTLIIFDSLYGNTEAVAGAVGQGISGDVQVISAKNADASQMENVDLLIVGSPTHGGRPSEKTQAFLKNIPAGALKNVRVAAFDTGIPSDGQSFFMKTLVKIMGYASKHILKSLEGRSGKTVVPAESFFVKDKEGPLREGELQRAVEWGKEIARKAEA